MVALVSLYFFLLPFQFALNPTETVDASVARVMAMVLGMAFLSHRFRSGSWLLPSRRDLFFMTGFLLIAALSFLLAREPSWTFRKVFFLVTFLPIWLICVDTFRREGSVAIRRVATGFFFGSVAMATVALLQFLSQWVFSLDKILSFWLSRIYPIFLGDAFAQSVATHSSLLVNIAGKTILRAVGIFPDPHVAAFYFGMAVPFGLWFSFSATPEKRWSFFLGTGILFLADLATFSRGGYVGLFAMLLFVGAFFLHQHHRSIFSKQGKKAVLVLVLSGALLLCVAPVRNRLMDIFSFTDGSNSARIILWQEAVSHISAHPMLGYGLGNYPLVVRGSADYREPIYIHNSYLDMWAELGIVGLLLFLGMVLLPVLTFFFSGNARSVAFPATLALVLFLAHSLFENILFSVHIFPVILFLLAVLSWYNRKAAL